MQEGDFVLLQDNQVERNLRPVGLGRKTFPSDEGKVSTARLFLRPVAEAVLLLPKDIDKRL